MKLELENHVAVVTGGASGIGLSCVRGLEREGCRVAVWDLADGLDVSDYGAVQEAVAEVGRIDHLVHAAAVGSGKFGFPFTNLEPQDWRRVMEVNVMGMVHVAHAVAPGMRARKSGTMVFLGSVAGQIGSQTDPPYSASKAATLNFAQCLAKDLAADGVRVNCVNPGMVKTPLNEQVWLASGARETYEEWALAKIRAMTPLGRWQEPEDVADLVCFLSSARAAQITGQAINVDGGQVMHS